MLVDTQVGVAVAPLIGPSSFRHSPPWCGYGDRPCPGPPRRAAPGRRRWSRSDAASATTGARWSRSQPEDLRAAATATTGLDDFGDAWWEEPFARLCASLDAEARLHLPGRIRTRGELQLILQNRLRMVDLWKREPAVLREPVHAPIVVTGLGRSGTTLLHELLACDPDNRPPLLWELLHTVPYDDASGDLCDDEITLMDEMVPAFTAMHENGGRLPDRVHLRLRPPVLERHVHRPLQRGRLHHLAQRRGPVPDLRLAQAPSPDAAVGGRAADNPLGRQGALPPLRPAPRSSRPTPTPGS